MNISLNQMVELLSALAGKPFEVPVQEQLKVILNYKRTDWFQKVLDKHPEQHKYYLRYISDVLIDVDENECPLPATGCTVKRTTNKIPLPVRNQHMLFWYVGDPDRTDGYTYTTPDQLKYMIKYGSRYTKDRPKYFYSNEYLYIYNEIGLEHVTIGAVWADPRRLNTFKCDDVPCYTDDDTFNIPEDVINMIVQDTLKNELKLILPAEDTQVTIDEK